MKLPTEKSKIKTAIEDYVLWVYGRPKVGKSTFCSNAPDALFLATDLRGLDGLSTYHVSIRTWEGMIEAANEIRKGGHKFKTIIVDTVDTAYLLCSEYICEQRNITDEGELEFGLGWRLVRQEFSRFFTKLGNLPYGIILVGHAQEIEIKKRTGKYLRMVPSLPNRKCREWLAGFVGALLYVDTEEIKKDDGTIIETRVIRPSATDYWDAGIRPQNIKLPDMIPLDWGKFNEAWNGGGKIK